ncbi:MAG TPA: DUF4233 domain-containing protein [Jiangellaceae bacterium]|nr:DUF4233 domain-containing protein [Jiangellaceae bacterium]
MNRIAATVLCVEAVVIALAIPAAVRLTAVDTAVAVTIGLSLAVACLVVAALLRRGAFAYYAGSLLQLAAILLGAIVPTMFVLGGIFAVLWFVALFLGGKVEAAEAARRKNGQP